MTQRTQNKFIAQSEMGKLKVNNAPTFRQLLKENDGMRFEIVPMTPESMKQRGFFEGAVVPLVVFFQEDMHHKNTDDLRNMRERLKIEFNGEFVPLGDMGVKKIGKSTKGKLNKGFLNRVIDWIVDSYGIDQSEVLNPAKYEKWRDEIFPYDTNGPDNYIDYLLETGRLAPLQDDVQMRV